MEKNNSIKNIVTVRNSAIVDDTSEEQNAEINGSPRGIPTENGNNQQPNRRMEINISNLGQQNRLSLLTFKGITGMEITPVNSVKNTAISPVNVRNSAIVDDTSQEQNAEISGTPTEGDKNQSNKITINIRCKNEMDQVTELIFKGTRKIRFTEETSFKNCVNMKTLSLTSIQVFPDDICHYLNTVPLNLEHLMIGDCENLPKDFTGVLKRLINLKSLRLENCFDGWNQYAQDLFVTIRNLEKLKTLELINIDFSTHIEYELKKCDGIRALLIIPVYGNQISQSATTNRLLIDCLKKLSKNLTHLFWGLTYELPNIADLNRTQYQENLHSIGHSFDRLMTENSDNNIRIPRTRKLSLKPKQMPTTKKGNDKSPNEDILSVPALEKLLGTMMLDAKTKVIKMPFSKTTNVYLSKVLDDL